MAVQKWRPYLLGHKFIIETDHQPLRVILTQTIHTPEQQRWMSKLMGYDFKVRYKPGCENGPADALSRFPDNYYMTLHGVSRHIFGVSRALRTLYRENEKVRALMKEIEEASGANEEFQVRDGLSSF